MDRAGRARAARLYVLGVGAIALVILWRLATSDHVGRPRASRAGWRADRLLQLERRAVHDAALLAIALSMRRELPGLLRGVLIALACAGLQLALIGQSRGWLFTLPLVVIVALCAGRASGFASPAAAVIPIVATARPDPRACSTSSTAAATAALDHAAEHAGRAGARLVFRRVFVIGTSIAWIDRVLPAPRIAPRAPADARRGRGRGRGPRRRRRRRRGHARSPGAVRQAQQLNGFTRRGDRRRRVALRDGRAVAVTTSGGSRSTPSSADPLIGDSARTTSPTTTSSTGAPREEPSWPHSLEMRLLAMTGIVGFVLFVGFLVASLTVVRSAAVRRSPRPARGGGRDRAAAARRLADPRLGRLVLGDARAERAGTRVPRDRRRAVESRRSCSRLRRRRPHGPRRAAGAAGVARSRRSAASRADRRRRRARLPLPVGPGGLDGQQRARHEPDGALSDLRARGPAQPAERRPGPAGRHDRAAGRAVRAGRGAYQQAIDREPGGWFAWFGQGSGRVRARAEAAAAARVRVAGGSRSASRRSSRRSRASTARHPLTPDAGAVDARRQRP